MYVDVYGTCGVPPYLASQKVERYYYDEVDLKSALTRGILRKGDLPRSGVVVTKDQSEDVHLEISRMNPIVLWSNGRRDDSRVGKGEEGAKPTYNYTYVQQGSPYGYYPNQQYYPGMPPYGSLLPDEGAQGSYPAPGMMMPMNGIQQDPHSTTPGQPLYSPGSSKPKLKQTTNQNLISWELQVATASLEITLDDPTSSLETTACPLPSVIRLGKAPATPKSDPRLRKTAKTAANRLGDRSMA